MDRDRDELPVLPRVAPDRACTTVRVDRVGQERRRPARRGHAFPERRPARGRQDCGPDGDSSQAAAGGGSPRRPCTAVPPLGVGATCSVGRHRSSGISPRDRPDPSTLIGPMRPTHEHSATSQRRWSQEIPAPGQQPGLVSERFRAFTARSVLTCHPPRHPEIHRLQPSCRDSQSE